MNQLRQAKGTVVAGRSAGGEFKAHERAASTFQDATTAADTAANHEKQAKALSTRRGEIYRAQYDLKLEEYKVLTDEVGHKLLVSHPEVDHYTLGYHYGVEPQHWRFSNAYAADGTEIDLTDDERDELEELVISGGLDVMDEILDPDMDHDDPFCDEITRIGVTHLKGGTGPVHVNPDTDSELSENVATHNVMYTDELEQHMAELQAAVQASKQSRSSIVIPSDSLETWLKETHTDPGDKHFAEYGAARGINIDQIDDLETGIDWADFTGFVKERSSTTRIGKQTYILM